MAKELEGEVAKVISTEKLTTSPVSLSVLDGQMSIHLERLRRNHQQQTAFASQKVLELNPYHPLIIKLAEAASDPAKESTLKDMTMVLYDQALIAEGEVIKNPSGYAERVSAYMLNCI